MINDEYKCLIINNLQYLKTRVIYKKLLSMGIYDLSN